MTEKCRQLKHPVNEPLLTQIGDMTVSFALLEDEFKSLVQSLIHEHQRATQIITSSLRGFEQTYSLLLSLYRERYGEDDDYQLLKGFVDSASKLEEERDRITHSTWNAGEDADTAMRIKMTTRRKEGIKVQFDSYTVERMKDFNRCIRELAYDVRSFRIRLIKAGKLINNPIQKQW